MYSLADGLQNFNIDCSCTAVVSVVVCFAVRRAAFGTFDSRELFCSMSGDPWNDVIGVKVEDLCVGVHSVGVKDFGKFQRLKYRLWKVVCEGIFIWAIYGLSTDDKSTCPELHDLLVSPSVPACLGYELKGL